MIDIREALSDLEKEMEEVRGRWNGKEPGRGEDEAQIASEIIKKIDELKDLLEELMEV